MPLLCSSFCPQCSAVQNISIITRILSILRFYLEFHCHRSITSSNWLLHHVWSTSCSKWILFDLLQQNENIFCSYFISSGFCSPFLKKKLVFISFISVTLWLWFYLFNLYLFNLVSLRDCHSFSQRPCSHHKASQRNHSLLCDHQAAQAEQLKGST